MPDNAIEFPGSGFPSNGAPREGHRLMCRQAAREKKRRLAVVGAGEPEGGQLHVVTAKAFLQILPVINTDRERFLSLLRSRPLVTHAEAIDALWGTSENGGPLYAQHILAIYISRLRRAGHVIENYRGFGYAIQGTGSGHAVE